MDPRPLLSDCEPDQPQAADSAASTFSDGTASESVASGGQVPDACPEAASPGSSYTLVNDPQIPRLLGKIEEHVKTGFQDTRVLEAQPGFIEKVVKVPFQLILNHSCVVLGAAGAGKTTICKALGGDKFNPNVEAGPHLRNRTLNAQAFDLELEGLTKDLRLVLIDTPGWSHETSTDIKSQYKQILKDKHLVSEHTPHIIMLCVPVSSIRQFQRDEAKKMSNQLQELKFDRRFPIKVLPVATKADTEHRKELPELLSAIKSLAEEAFQNTGAEVEEPLSTSFPPGGQPQGVQELKALLERVLHSQLCSAEFRCLWQKALAQRVAADARMHCETFPQNDSALRVFKSGCCTVAAACGKHVERLDFDWRRATVEELPWSDIELIPTTEVETWKPPELSNCSRIRMGIRSRPGFAMTIAVAIMVVLTVIVMHCNSEWQWTQMTRRFEHAETASKLAQKKADEMSQKETALQEQLDQTKGTLKHEEAVDQTLAGTMCKWDVQSKQCLGLNPLAAVKSADKCQQACCKLGRELCSVWQYRHSGELERLHW
ncbi:unnamed protein product [Durusdinium trenchii]|uniref:G domain-containing protein n=1 Tax=Durusdinium trenchii TaxID=1381693 RepID=A0ABP0Q6W0_9DINO